MAVDSLRNTCSLLSVPPEIRWIIFRLLFRDIRIKCERTIPPFEQSFYYWLNLRMPAEFGILLTCRQLLEEGRRHFYEQATFDLRDMPSYESFFDVLSPSIREHVRSIEGLKFTRGVQSFTSSSMKPEVADMQRWLQSFTNLSKISVAIDTVVTLQEERFHGIESVDEVTYEDVLDIIVSPVTSTGRPKWSLKPLIDLIESHPQVDFAVILKVRTMTPHFQGVRSLDKMVIHMDVKNKTIRLADISYSEGVFVTEEPQIQTRVSGAVSSGRGGRRIAYTRGGIFVL